MVVLMCKREEEGYKMIGMEEVVKNDFANGVVLTVGTFDGMHVGHKQVIRRTVEIANNEKPCVVVTFDQHPRAVIDSINGFKVLSSISEKLERIEKMNVSHAVVLEFTKMLSEDPPDYFLENFLLKELKMRHFVSGYDHGFGKNRRGSMEFFKEKAKEYMFDFTIVEQYNKVASEISSSKIRHAIEAGEIALANELLGEPYTFSGIVIRGDGRGKQLLFPTANLKLVDSSKCLPSRGVFMVTVVIKGNMFAGMMNIGFKPTVSNEKTRSIEVHILNYYGDLYKQTLVIQCLKKIREEKKFDNLFALQEQLECDKQFVQSEVKHLTFK